MKRESGWPIKWTGPGPGETDAPMKRASAAVYSDSKRLRIPFSAQSSYLGELVLGLFCGD